MQNSTTQGQVSLISPSGARKSWDGQGGANAEILGDVFHEAHEAAQSGDTILLGPGDFADHARVGKEGVTLEGCRGLTRFVPRTGESSVRYHPRRGQRFIDLGSDNGSFIFYHTEGDIADPDDVTDIWVVGCEIEGGEDLVYFDHDGDGSIREWHLLGNKLKTRTTGGSANDATFFHAPNARLNIRDNVIECTGQMVGLDMTCLDIGGAGCIAYVRDNHLRFNPTAMFNPNEDFDGGCIASGNGAKTYAAGNILEVVPAVGAFSGFHYFALFAFNLGEIHAHASNFLLPYDPDLFGVLDSGLIVPCTDVVPSLP